MRHTPSFLRHAASIQPRALEPILRLWLLRMVVPPSCTKIAFAFWSPHYLHPRLP